MRTSATLHAHWASLLICILPTFLQSMLFFFHFVTLMQRIPPFASKCSYPAHPSAEMPPLWITLPQRPLLALSSHPHPHSTHCLWKEPDSLCLALLLCFRSCICQSNFVTDSLNYLWSLGQPFSSGGIKEFLFMIQGLRLHTVSQSLWVHTH